LPLAERKLIERIRRLVPPGTGPLIQGIGDDSAVLRVSSRYELLVTTDLYIEDVHFRPQWHPPQSVGHRCLARGLSDIAAMGGEPVACFLSLGLPAKLPQAWVDGFLHGLTRLARRFKVQLAGGDVSSARNITADIVVIGQVPAGKAVLRSGAKPGDRIYVTGELGGSAAVVERLYNGKRVRPSGSSRHFYPQPRIAVGRWLRRQELATAMIDLSDGLSVDLSHICKESRVAATIRAAAIPVATGAELKLALHGGEDYELLFTASPQGRVPAKIAGVQVTEIGVIDRQKDYRAVIHILNENGRTQALLPKGWQHFARR
jgi:thiamine-monophosphate kinase